MPGRWSTATRCRASRATRWAATNGRGTCGAAMCGCPGCRRSPRRAPRPWRRGGRSAWHASRCSLAMTRFGVIVAAALLAVPAAAQAEEGNWAGFHVGAHFGGGSGRSSWFDHGAGDIGAHDAGGVLGGGQAGYDFQSGRLVFGPQVELSGASLGGDHPDAVFQGPALQTDHADIDRLGTITGRLGYAADPWLFYGRAGAAWAHERYSFQGFFAPGLEFAAHTTTKWGWTAVPGCGPPGAGAIGVSIRENFHIVKTGINFRF